MTVSSPPGAPAPKKGLSPLAWVGIGCGVIVVLGVIAMVAVGYFVKKKVGKFADNPAKAAAELLVRANPELELVKSDDVEMTVRNKKTGEEITVNYEDAKEGKFEFKTKEGTTSLDMQGGDTPSLTVTDDQGQESSFTAGASPEDVPDWVPTYPDATPQGAYAAETSDGRSGAFTVSTTDDVDEVIGFYEKEFKDAGLQVQKSTMSGGGQRGGTVTGTSSDEKRTVTVAVGSSNEGTAAMVTYNEKQ